MLWIDRLRGAVTEEVVKTTPESPKVSDHIVTASTRLKPSPLVVVAGEAWVEIRVGEEGGHLTIMQATEEQCVGFIAQLQKALEAHRLMKGKPVKEGE